MLEINQKGDDKILPVDDSILLVCDCLFLRCGRPLLGIFQASCRCKGQLNTKIACPYLAAISVKFWPANVQKQYVWKAIVDQRCIDQQCSHEYDFATEELPRASAAGQYIVKTKARM